ncbi:MAG TPA: hypothetical protein VNH18_04115 [Bryobacteraceae bacterium]|nr:hypothetical protein [Bryobacteraceae bacterium]
MNWWQKYRELIEFVGLVIAWPVLAYLAIFQTWEMDPCSNTHGTPAILLISGLAAWVALKLRRG